MAIFRKIHVSFWSDSFISELNESQKLFYIYLLTNERTTQSGIYEITKRQISFDLGYSIDTVSILLNYFQENGKILYNSETCEIAIKNWNKFNHNPSGKVQVLVNKELAKIKDKKLIDFLYSIDTVSIHNPQEEEEEEEEKEIYIPPSAFKFLDSLIALGAEKKLASDWIRVRKTKKLTNTETAFDGFSRELKKSKKEINFVLRQCVEHSWGGFEAKWLNSTQNNTNNNLAKGIL